MLRDVCGFAHACVRKEKRPRRTAGVVWSYSVTVVELSFTLRAAWLAAATAPPAIEATFAPVGLSDPRNVETRIVTILELRARFADVVDGVAVVIKTAAALAASRQ